MHNFFYQYRGPVARVHIIHVNYKQNFPKQFHCISIYIWLYVNNFSYQTVGFRESVAAAAGALGLCKVLCWLPLIPSRNSIPTILC